MTVTLDVRHFCAASGLLAILKWSGVIAWPWVAVTAPMWGAVMAMAILAAFIAAVEAWEGR